MADLGIKVSSGIDITKATEKDIIFSSQRNLLKTDALGVAGSTSFGHGLSYTPIFFTSGGQSSSAKGAIIGDDLVTTCDNKNFNPAANTKWYLFFQQSN